MSAGGGVWLRLKRISEPDTGIKGIRVQRGKPLACPTCGSTTLNLTDKYADFKLDSRIISLPTAGNAANLTANFVSKRSQTLTGKEIDVLVRDMWGEIEEGQPFLPSMTWWDSCQEDLPPLRPNEPVVLALDAATGRVYSSSDCFAIVGVTRHPNRNRADTDVAVRFVYTWSVGAGQKIDFRGTPEEPGPERVILRLCGHDIDRDGNIIPSTGRYRVNSIVYDSRTGIETGAWDKNVRLYNCTAAGCGTGFKLDGSGFRQTRYVTNCLAASSTAAAIGPSVIAVAPRAAYASRVAASSGSRITLPATGG